MGVHEYVIVGLGNPGLEYCLNRHNVGFMVVDELAKQWTNNLFQEKKRAAMLSLLVQGQRVHLIKPVTFMNRSGGVVAEYVQFFKMQPDQLMVIHDDLDMALGRIKMVYGGGAGGHNGIKSLVDALGTKDFFRLKIGIGRPGKGDIHPDFPVDKYVLSNFSEPEFAQIISRYEDLVRGVSLFLQKESAKAMSFLNALR